MGTSPGEAEMNPVMAATREEGEGEAESSEREEAISENLPNRRPSMLPGEEVKRLMMEARVGPEIVTFCKGRSSMAGEREREREREREGKRWREGEAEGERESCGRSRLSIAPAVDHWKCDVQSAVFQISDIIF